MPIEPLLTETQIQRRIEQLAGKIRQDYGDEPVLLVSVLKGSFVFLADLCRRLGQNVSLDFVHVSSYGDGMRSTGVVQIRKDLDINIEGKNVLLVEDIVDTGATLVHLLELLGTRHPKSLKVVSLLTKPSARREHAPIDYVGFEIEDGFVVGYGLDHAERYRNLPYIAVLRDVHPPD
jgi:hypoxanthine phosphoribosyltransferase